MLIKNITYILFKKLKTILFKDYAILSNRTKKYINT